jgi:hypothetical protein
MEEHLPSTRDTGKKELRSILIRGSNLQKVHLAFGFLCFTNFYVYISKLSVDDLQRIECSWRDRDLYLECTDMKEGSCGRDYNGVSEPLQSPD